jgi:F-type H+-transporting ATPase subunit epsilon
MNSFLLEIVTPDRQFFKGDSEGLILHIQDGLYGIEPGHEPAVTAVEAGEIRYKVDGRWQLASVSTGFAEIMPRRVILLVAAAELPEEIDLHRAKAARERAEERLRQQKSLQEYYSSKAALARAMARLRTVQKSRRR